MKSILLPTDFSDPAHNAFAYAYGLYGSENVSYTLLHTYEEPQRRANVLISVRDILEEQAFSGMHREMKWVAENYPLLSGKVESKVACGTLREVLDRQIKEATYHVVIMGTTGASGLKKMTLGSNTSEVLRYATCPVIAVPEHVTYYEPLNIAFAADFKSTHSDGLLNPLTELADMHHSRLHIVNFGRTNPDEKLLREKVKKQLTTELHGHVAGVYETAEKTFIQGIQEFVLEQKIDLVAMISRKHNLFERMFRRSMTGEMAMLAKLPLLILHDH